MVGRSSSGAPMTIGSGSFGSRLISAACRAAVWTLWTLWLISTGWLAVYGMWGSAACAATAATVSRPGGQVRGRWRALIWAVGLAAVPLIGLPEYAVTTAALHCRTLGFMGGSRPAVCSGEDWAHGAEVAREGGRSTARGSAWACTASTT